ncbi:hypothetical protein RclHR1_00010039 [Rhizophagus clarus]|uniref:CCHC-type domain-containing protein n=1 Tax=Rhizophagus clarus TaxID=94130 RepID=A0A2Z6Q0F3_9GLOM|nr:hypothetical protein RclHR1_00010039 [Rhizophagus clarus]GES75166.1 hypothetical protein RCL_jg13227.t1 [Rhizophagus clarus]
METVYVLECSNNKYYVGKTTRSVDIRFREHRNGTGSEWTRLYQPIRIAESEQTDNVHLELTKTLDYMNRYGIDNVRGGSFSNVNLTETQRQEIRRMLSSANDTCFRCGRASHFAYECDYSYYTGENNLDESDSENDEDDESDNSYKCFRCGSPNHFANECDAETSDDDEYHPDITCYRCGEIGHYANNCRRFYLSGY